MRRSKDTICKCCAVGLQHRSSWFWNGSSAVSGGRAPCLLYMATCFCHSLDNWEVASGLTHHVEKLSDDIQTFLTLPVLLNCLARLMVCCKYGLNMFNSCDVDHFNKVQNPAFYTLATRWLGEKSMRTSPAKDLESFSILLQWWNMKLDGLS